MSIILLDIGNVIVSVDFDPFCRAASRDGTTGPETIRNRYCDSSLKDRLDRGLVAPGEFLGMLAEDPDTVDMPVHFFRNAWQRIFTPVPGSVEAIASLREHHEIWIMSDTDPLHFAHLIDTYPVMRGQDRYFLSYEHGLLKRNAEAFRHVLGTSGHDPDRFMLVDDRPVNVESCRRVGIEGILFNNWSEVLTSPRLSGGRSRRS